MTPRAVILTRLIAVRLLWYAGIGAIAFLALALHTPFSVAAVLSAIAIYIPLSMLSLPVMAWLSVNRGMRAQNEGTAHAAVTPSRALPSALPSAWPAVAAAVLGVVLLASARVWANLDLAECGVLLLLVAGDLSLARREAVQYLRLAAAGQG